MPASYQIRLCQNPSCGLRYPLTEGHPFGDRCPVCLGQTEAVIQHSLDPEPAPPLNQPRLRLEILLDNLRSAWNVGAIFRTADGLGVSKLHLCGITPTPGTKEVQKTALGAEKTVPWEYAPNAVTKAESLRAKGVQIWALEQDPRATTDFATDAFTDSRMGTDFQADLVADSRIKTDAKADLVLIVGNEVTGVDPALLDLCDRIVHIPMHGYKRSLNVEVACGIAIDRVFSTDSFTDSRI